jgi:hypothetical protein
MKKSRKHPKIKIESFGRFSNWNRTSKELPQILEFTNTIKAKQGNEFGIILHISAGKGTKLDYCIKHPPFKDMKGNIEPEFTGTYFINSNDYRFYIGDCIWLPVEDKIGPWEILVEWEGEIIAQQIFEVID